MSRAIAAQPDVVFLSELNPNQRKPFAPADPFPQVLINYPHLLPGRRIADVFTERIDEIYAACESRGLSLVIRDHSHADFLLRNVRQPELCRVLRKAGYDLKSIVTIRDPVDAWLSMAESGFHIGLRDFTAYCERVMLFFEHYRDLPLFRYEDFVANFHGQTEKMAAALGLTFDPKFEDRMDRLRLSGDSGRLGGIPDVQRLLRRPISPALRGEINSPSNQAILRKLGYEQVV